MESARNYLYDGELMKYIKPGVIETAEAAYIGRRLCSIKEVDYGKEWEQYQTETAANPPDIGGAGMTIPLDSGAWTDNFVRIYKLAKGFRITNEARAREPSLIAKQARAITKQIGKLEDELIQVGWADSDSTQVVNGLYNSATPTLAVSNTWGSSSATPYSDVNNVIAQMEAVGFTGPYVMSLTATNRGEARERDTMGNKAWDHILDIGVTDIYLSSRMAANTGMIIEPGQDNAEIILPQNLTINPPFPLSNQVSVIYLTEWVTQVTYQAYSVGTLTSL
jgi:hypothetical protein